MSEDSAKKFLAQVSFLILLFRKKNMIRVSAIPVTDPLKTGDWLGTENWRWHSEITQSMEGEEFR